MKKTIMAIVAMFVGMMMARAEWAAPIQTTYTNVITETVQLIQTNTTEVVLSPAFVKLDSIMIRALPNDGAMVNVGWSWLDADKKVVRRGIKTFNKEQISAKLASAGSSFESMQALFTMLAAEDAVTPE